MKFSDRYGYTKPREALQLEAMDIPLRNALWNLIVISFDLQPQEPNIFRNDPLPNLSGTFYAPLWVSFMKEPVDAVAREHPHTNFRTFREWFYKVEWFQVYNLIEFLVTVNRGGSRLRVGVNAVLKEEGAAYTMISDLIVPVSSEAEVKTLEAAVSPVAPESVARHIADGLRLVAERKRSDYRNVVKEAISAVEAASIVVSGKKKADLGDALAHIERTYGLHPALRQAFEKMYGYASDAQGIRHNLEDGDRAIDRSTAVFLLVTCASFANYLLSLKSDR